MTEIGRSLPVSPARPAVRVAVAESLVAAFLWAAWYPLVLWATPGTAPSAIVAYPFAFGGVVYVAFAVAQGHGAEFVALWRSPLAYVRTMLLVGVQFAIVAATYLIGPVDASLLSLFGDVVATPVIAAMYLLSSRRSLSRPWVAAGLSLTLFGGSLAIAGGQRLTSVPPIDWSLVVLLPVAVAGYFLLSARASERTPASAVVAHATVGSAVVTVLVSLLMPGGGHALVHVGLRPLGLLVLTGVTSFFVGPVLYFRAIGRAGFVIPPMLMTGIPVFTLLLSAALLGLGLPLLGLLGIPVAVAGALLALRDEDRRRETEPPRGLAAG